MRPHAIRDEFPRLLTLAFPLILGELGWVAMSVVDTAMLGRTSTPSLSLAASALAQVLFNTLAFGVGGVLLALDPLISQALGEGDRHTANRWFLHGLATALLLAVMLSSLVFALPLLLLRLPVDRGVLAQALPALRGLNYGVLPLLLYFALRRYLQAAHQGKAIMGALISANLVNVAGNWLLIYGRYLHLGTHILHVPAFGVTGSAWSTSAARVYLVLFLLDALLLANRRHNYALRSTERRLDLARLTHIVRLGAPVGAQIFVEVAIFALATSVIATFGAVPLAAHEIALQCASTTYMVPLAISAATSVRVGHAIGRWRVGEAALENVAAAGWSGILAGAGFMLLAALAFVLIPAKLAGLFTADPQVVHTAVQLLWIAAAFQFFDGIQTAATGALRGAGKTLAPLIVQVLCFWVVAMPLGTMFAIHFHGGAEGMWWGLAVGLMPAAVGMLIVWQRTSRDPSLLKTNQEESIADSIGKPA